MKALTNLLRYLCGRVLSRTGGGGEPTEVAVAGGGILWRRTTEGLECAIVFRGRYRGEPGLPKGKIRPGESLQQAALREVKEETGCDALLLRYVGSTSYAYDDTRKVVFFWNMAVRGEASFQPSEEVERVEWLTTERAMDTLKHLEEKEILSRASRAVGEPTQGGMFEWLKCLWIKTLPSARYARLEGSLRVTQAEVERRICEQLRAAPDRSGKERADSAGRASRRCWADAALSLLAEANSAFMQGRIDQAWRLLHAARRMEILALDEKAELPAMVAVLRQEAEKLKSWRQKAIHDLLGTQEKPKDAGAGEVYQAALIRDEHYNNQAYKDGLIRTQILWLVLILAAVVGGLLWMGGSGHLLATGFYTFVGVALFGLLGGTVSAMLQASDAGQSSRIPETTAAIRVTFMRVCMGAASALIVYVFLKSELPGVLNQELTKGMKTLEPFTAYSIAFVAGFSERLVLRAVEHVGGKERPREKEKK